MIMIWKEKFMNLPNKISITRILLMPIFILVYLLDFPGSKFIALGLFIIAAISDAVDGHIARKYNLITDLGKFLDPIADKLLATTGLILLITGPNPIIPMPYGVIFMFIMILRDYVVTGLRQIAQLKGIVIAADKWAKIKANFLYASLVYGLLISALKEIDAVANHAFMTYFTIVFYVFVGITTILIINSGLVYVIKNAKVFAEDKNPATEQNVITTQEEPVEEVTEEKVAKDVNKKSSTVKKSTKKTNKTNSSK